MSIQGVHFEYNDGSSIKSMDSRVGFLSTHFKVSRHTYNLGIRDACAA